MDLQPFGYAGVCFNREIGRGRGAEKFRKTEDLIYALGIGAVGLAAGRILFARVPCLCMRARPNSPFPKGLTVSVIIPARNEAHTLPHLLKDLAQQTTIPLEIICVDDDSTDDTASVAAAYGAKVIAAPPRPKGWLGKPWACQTGALAAEGKQLLFLDADVRLAPDAITALLYEYGRGENPISVAPYHAVPAGYEQLSLIMNMVAFGANGASLPRQQAFGLFGPLILMSKTHFQRIEGFFPVRSCIAEDVALGEQFKKTGLTFRVYAGGPLISFRMCSQGIPLLVKGWVKNLSTGAAKCPRWLCALTFLWIASCASVPVYFVCAAMQGSKGWLAIQTLLFFLWIAELYRIAKKLGSFKLETILLYPLSLGLFIVLFITSSFKKALKRPVEWKDRQIDWRE